MAQATTTPTPHPVKAIIAMRRLTNRELATHVGCNPGTLGRIINNIEPSWPALRARMAAFFDMPEDELFDGIER